MNEEDAAAIEELLAKTDPASDEDIKRMKPLLHMFLPDLIKEPRMQDWMRRNAGRIKQMAIEGTL